MMTETCGARWPKDPIEAVLEVTATFKAEGGTRRHNLTRWISQDLLGKLEGNWGARRELWKDDDCLFKNGVYITYEPDEKTGVKYLYKYMNGTKVLYTNCTPGAFGDMMATDWEIISLD